MGTVTKMLVIIFIRRKVFLNVIFDCINETRNYDENKSCYANKFLNLHGFKSILTEVELQL